MVRNQSNTPFYELAELQNLVRADKMKFATDRARTQATELDFDKNAISAFILALKPDHFLKRHPNLNCFSGRATLNADAYKMRFDKDTLTESNRSGDLIYTKLGIHKLPSQDLVAVISFHLDGSP